MSAPLTKDEAKVLCAELNARVARLMTDRYWQPRAKVTINQNYDHVIEFTRHVNRGAKREGNKGTRHRLLLATSSRERVFAHWAGYTGDDAAAVDLMPNHQMDIGGAA